MPSTPPLSRPDERATALTAQVMRRLLRQQVYFAVLAREAALLAYINSPEFALSADGEFLH
jgi:hypothetical protein